MTADAAAAGGGHYFADDPAAGSAPVDVDVVLPDASFTLATDRGVFSRGKLDTGTAILLRAGLPLAGDGDLLDLGCGAGPIALTMATRSPDATVWAIDVNERARRLAAANAARNGIENVRVTAPEEVPGDVRFSTIWSNPPIRIGKVALREMLTAWLDRLTPAGSAAIVVQKHLGADSLQRWLSAEGYRTERVTSKAGYRVIAVTPRPPHR